MSYEYGLQPPGEPINQWGVARGESRHIWRLDSFFEKSGSAHRTRTSYFSIQKGFYEIREKLADIIALVIAGDASLRSVLIKIAYLPSLVA